MTGNKKSVNLVCERRQLWDFKIFRGYHCISKKEKYNSLFEVSRPTFVYISHFALERYIPCPHYPVPLNKRKIFINSSNYKPPHRIKYPY
jgi:hypothetical protein